MYVLRGKALAAKRGDSPDLSTIYAPGSHRQARRRLITVWALSAGWIPALLPGGVLLLAAFVATFLGLVIALSTQFEAAWIGSPIRPWTLYAMPVAAAGIAAGVAVL
jgi:hypothetical protein